AQGTTSISSVDYAGAMLPWAIIQSFHLKEIGVGILTLCTLALVLWNRRKLAQENEQLAEANAEVGK
ncbi:PTS sugar transporter subunit IIC, partial [Raoultella sp. Ech2A]|nr:PTS sugar transporter subunit IIC [Raoultella sp. Ech2A]